MLSHNQGKYGDDYHCEKVLGHTELGGGGYTDRQTDRKGKERGLLLGSVPAVSHRDQAWGSEILSTGTLLPSGGASGPGRLPGLPREKGARRAGEPARQARSQEHSSLASLRGPEGTGTVRVAGGKWTWE